jgi:3-oxoacyl-[acyl-carrier protein] reductase
MDLELKGRTAVAVDAPDDVWDESFAIDFTAVRKLTQPCLPSMRARQWGASSTSPARRSHPASTRREPAKAAVHAWAKGLSREVGRDGITVNCLAPGRIHSEQIDQRLHPTEESRREFARQIPLGYFGDPASTSTAVTGARTDPQRTLWPGRRRWICPHQACSASSMR